MVRGWIRDLYMQYCPDDFLHPFTLERDFAPAVIAGASDGVWYDLGVCRVYYGKGYERGDVQWFLTFAEWIESHIDGCEVWYGHDADLDALRPFGVNERTALLAYYR